jgi:hypothetical protein
MKNRTAFQRLTLFLSLAAVVCFANALLAQAPACQATYTTGAADTLAGISSFYFGSGAYGRAILQATNSRAGTGSFKFMGNPDQLPTGATLCIPELPEASRRRLRYDDYERSVQETVLPKQSQVSQSLVKAPATGPVRVASWIRADEVSRYKPNGAWITAAQKDMWVTIIPEIKDFCQAWVKEHTSDVDQITLRLEQRLGLPPGAAKTTFLEIIVKDPSTTANLFRPCKDPSATTAKCDAGPPAASNATYVSWFYQQYYGSFAQAFPDQYPWTSLGYTFDWAAGKENGFVRYGASEFVIPKGAPIEIVGSTDTGQYCKSSNIVADAPR